MKYRVEMGHDGFLIYIPVPNDAKGPNVYNVDTGSDGNLTHIKDDVDEVQRSDSKAQSVSDEQL